MTDTEKLIKDLKQLGKYSSLEPNYLLLAAEKIEELSGNQIKTNYDRIRNMSVEEMAEAIKNAVEDCEKHCAFTKNGKCNSFGDGDACAKGIELWLESEVDTE